jgi:hypothetical protein
VTFQDKDIGGNNGLINESEELQDEEDQDENGNDG